MKDKFEPLIKGPADAAVPGMNELNLVDTRGRGGCNDAAGDAFISTE